MSFHYGKDNDSGVLSSNEHEMHLRREYAISLRNILFKEIVSHLVMYLFDQSKIQVDCLTPKKILERH